MRPRWYKVFRDLWSNKTRTLLVVLSIAVGICAVGIIASAQIVLNREMNAAYAATNPASATIDVAPFDSQLVQTVRHMAGVRDAAGFNSVATRFLTAAGDWRNVDLIVVPDFNHIQINTITSESGAWPPQKRQILLERTSLEYLGARVGDTVVIETSSGKQYQLEIAGLVHDLSVGDARVGGKGRAYVSLDGLELLGEGRLFDEMRIVVADRPDDKDHIYDVALEVQKKIEKAGYTVYGLNVPTPGQHWASDIMKPLLLILGVLGTFSLILSGFLVTNTVAALLTQQTRQIGVIKAIGARTSQVIGLYVMTILMYSLLSLAVAVPLGVLGAWAFVRFNAHMLNIDYAAIDLPPQVLLLEIIAGLVVPLLAALWPIITRTRITVRDALSATGLDSGGFGARAIERGLGRLRGISRPQLISLRNMFRRRMRLALTLATLTLSGAMMISVFTIRDSLLHTLDTFYQIYQNDIFVDMSDYYRVDQLQNQALQVPGVKTFEPWGSQSMRRVRPNGTESNAIEVKAPPANTQLFRPILLEGRWLDPSDENAIVIANSLLAEEPDLRIGDDLMLKIGERVTHWRIVGITQVMFAQNLVYANYAYFARTIGPMNRSGYALVATTQHDDPFRTQVAAQLADQFHRAGMRLQAVRSIAEDRQQQQERFNILVAFLMGMALLLGIVGGLSLMGTMSISVLERTREIGVMRAIGASNGAVLRIVLLEGVFIGLLSWLFAMLIALPISKLISDAVGVAFLRLPLSYVFSIGGVFIWLSVVVLLAAAASFIPARQAARITVRDALAYE